MSADLKWASEERKLNSVYDDLNDRRHKSAQSTLDRHLKKNPNSQPALALSMALAQQTVAGEDVILSLWERCRNTGPMSSRSSYIALYALRGAGRQVYKSLWNTRPEQLQFAEEAFFCSSAIRDSESMISISRTVYNKSKDPKWARLAAWSNYEMLYDPVGLAKPSDDPVLVNARKTSALLLSLANRQQPIVEETNYQIIWLTIRNLCVNESKPAALKLAVEHGQDGDLLRLSNRMDFAQHIIGEMEEGEERRAALAVEYEWVCSYLLENTSFLNYIFCRHLIWVTSRIPGNSRRTRQLLTLLHRGRTRQSERGYMMAILELDLSIPNNERLGKEQWYDALQVYWHVSGGRSSAVPELLHVIGDEEWKREQLDGLIAQNENSPIVTANDYFRALNIARFKLLKKGSDWIPAAKEIQQAWDLHLLPTVQSIADLPPQDPTDIYPGESAGFWAIHMLVLQWLKKPSDEKPLLTAAACALSIQERSSASGLANFTLIRLARLIGASGLIPDKWLTPDGPNEVQLETLLHPVIERASGEVYAKTIPSAWSSSVERAEKMYKRSMADIPEQIKVALQNESYSAISGIRRTIAKLDKSLAAGITRIERARLTLMSGALPSPERLRYIEKAVTQAAGGKGTMYDTRDWDLMPGFDTAKRAPLPGLKESTTLIEVIEEGWILAWGNVLLSLARYLSGQPAAEPEKIDDDNENITKEERVLLSGLGVILGRIEGASTELSKEELKAVDRDASGETFSGLFNGLLPEELEGSRFSKLYPLQLIVEVSKLLERIHKRVKADAQTIGTGRQKKKADPRIVALEKAISELRLEVADIASKGVDRLDKLAKEDESVSALTITSALEGLEVKYAQSVVDSRKASIDNLCKVLRA